MNRALISGVLAFALGASMLQGCGRKEEMVRQVSFREEVQPILQQYCIECHRPGGKGTVQSGLDMTSYDALMRGTRYGRVVKPGDSLTSALIMLVEGRADPSIKMPHGREPLPTDKIATLRTWIEQGARNN